LELSASQFVATSPGEDLSELAYVVLEQSSGVVTSIVRAGPTDTISLEFEFPGDTLAESLRSYQRATAVGERIVYVFGDEADAATLACSLSADPALGEQGFSVYRGVVVDVK
jgi:hypothetical protein